MNAKRAIMTLGEIFLLLQQTMVAVFTRPPRRHLVIDQLHEVGVRSLSIVNLTAVFTGMVMALQLGYFLSKFGAKIFVSRIVGIAVISELGPVLTALMIGGRVGAGMAAELGTMKVTEQIDALRALGSDPIRYLVVPRMVAITIMLPLLTGMSDLVGILGGLFVSYVELNVQPTFYVTSLLQFLTLGDLARSLAKAAVFAVIIGAIACRNGMAAEGGADGVGRATTRSVVGASISVLVSDFFLTKLMLML
ncbi:MAG: ABC transporter permease [Candidatus Dadabacteria bacterium]|nr:MAG: ABC transporter permease [Candidatus Dadabacteria bacterium]